MTQTPQPSVSFNPDKLDELRHCYNKARKAGIDVFKYDGNDYFIDYAKFLIQYLEMKLTPNQKGGE